MSMLPTLSTSSSCFGFRLRFNLITLLVHLSFGLGLGAWVGGKGGSELGLWQGVSGAWVGGGGVWRHERSESSERELKVLRRKEKKGNKNNILIKGRINFFFLLTFNYSAHLFIDVHCSNEGKIFTFSSTTIVWIFVFWWN